MFCRHCGIELSDGAKFCAGCGAQLPVRQAVPAPAPARAMNPNTAAEAPRKKGIMDYLMIPMAVILILIGIGHMALAVVGRTVTAQVTGYEQALILNNDESTWDSRRYELEYQFSVKRRAVYRFCNQNIRGRQPHEKDPAGALSALLAACKRRGRRGNGLHRPRRDGIGRPGACASGQEKVPATKRRMTGSLSETQSKVLKYL